MKKFYLVVWDGDPVRVFSSKIDADKYVELLQDINATFNVVIQEIEGF